MSDRSSATEEFETAEMARRSFLGATAAVGSAFAVQQTDDDDSIDTSGGDAVNVDDADTIEEADEVSYDRQMSVSHLSQLFLAWDTARHPVIDTEIRFRAMVGATVTAEADRQTFADELQWANFEPEGDRVLEPLFDHASWIASPGISIPDSFYDEYALVRLFGVEDSDQGFYEKYGHVPSVWAVAPADRLPDPGDVVDVTGAVSYAQSDDDTVAEGVGDGVIVDVSSTSRVTSLTSLSADTSSGQRSSFAGVQELADPILTTEFTDVAYEYDQGYPRPEGGSLLSHEGRVDSVQFDESGTNRASLVTDRQGIIVGDTRSGTWESGDEAASEFTNTVAVLDISGSMDDTDTRSGDSRLDVAKDSARSLVNYVESGNRLGVAAFSTRSSVVSPLTAVEDQSVRDRLIDDISDLYANGDTSIGAGLQQALEMLRDVQGPKSVILMSDGEQNTAPHPRSVLPELRSLGVTVYTIGMGSSADRALLGRIADETGGEMRFRPDPGEVRSLFQNFAVVAQERSTLTTARAALREGDTMTDTVTVDGSCDDVQFSLSYPGSTITIEPERPDGSPVSEDEAMSHRVGETNEVWTIDNPDTGEWSFTVTGEQLEREEEATVEVNADSDIDAKLFVSDFHYDQTGMYRIELKATDGRRRYTGGDVTLTAQIDDQVEEIELRDDRGGPDPVANDGIYTGYFHPQRAGTYEFTATIAGGEVGELERDFTRQLTVENVVEEPVRPYRDREPVSSDFGSDGGSMVELVGGAAVLAGLGTLAKRHFVDN